MSENNVLSREQCNNAQGGADVAKDTGFLLNATPPEVINFRKGGMCPFVPAVAWENVARVTQHFAEHIVQRQERHASLIMDARLQNQGVSHSLAFHPRVPWRRAPYRAHQ